MDLDGGVLVVDGRLREPVEALLVSLVWIGFREVPVTLKVKKAHGECTHGLHIHVASAG